MHHLVWQVLYCQALSLLVYPPRLVRIGIVIPYAIINNMIRNVNTSKKSPLLKLKPPML